MALKNPIEMRQMTLNDPKFDIKISLDTLLKGKFANFLKFCINLLLQKQHSSCKIQFVTLELKAAGTNWCNSEQNFLH